MQDFDPFTVERWHFDILNFGNLTVMPSHTAKLVPRFIVNLKNLIFNESVSPVKSPSYKNVIIL